MRLSKRQLRALVLIGVVLGVVLAPFLGAAAGTLVSSVFPTEATGTIPYQSNNGLVVNFETSGGTNLSDGNPFPNDSTVDIDSQRGNISVSAPGSGNVTVENPEGTWTNTSIADVSSTTVTFDPADKAKLGVTGNTDNLDWKDYAVDDGAADVYYSGASGDTTLTFYGLPSSTTIGLVDVNSNEVLGNATTDSNGKITLTVPNSGHTASLQTGVEPDVDNPQPNGPVSEQPDKLNVSISDGDFPQDEVNVTFYLNGDDVGTKSLTSNGTAEVDVTGYSNWNLGENDWWVVANDSYGNSVNTSNKGWVVDLPNELEIRNETSPNNLVKPTKVSVRWFNGTTLFNRTTTTGTINMSGLPADKRYIVTADADTYHKRTVLLDDITEQSTIYLLNDSLGVEIRFELEDRTGEFPQDSVLFVDLPINQSGSTTYQTIVSDRFGPNGVTGFLQEGERHRLRVRNPDGDVRILGGFTPTIAETVVLEIGQVSIRNAPDGSTYEWDAVYTNESNNPQVEFDYADPEDETTDLRVRIFERGNESNEIHDSTTAGPVGNVSITQSLTSQQANKTWVVKWTADRGGEEITGRRVVGATVNLGVPIDPLWKNTASVALIVIIGGAMGGISAPLAAISTALLGGVLWFVGWLPAGIGGGAVALALLIAVGFSLFTRR